MNNFKTTTGIFYGEIFIRFIFLASIPIIFLLPLNDVAKIFFTILALILILKSSYHTISVEDYFVNKKFEIKSNYLIPYFNKVYIFDSTDVKSIELYTEFQSFILNFFTRSVAGSRPPKHSDHVTITKTDGTAITININLEPKKAETIIKKFLEFI